MIGMTRANICEPFLVEKLRKNQVTQIRPCVRANICIANRYIGKPIARIHNSEINRPELAFIKTQKSLKLAVIGAGTTGLELARLAVQKGHQVTVYESNSMAGGQPF
jgi:NADPH-dependent 2,4-dienoyl-CoA reductase/sulfur reductase-like enzyme